MNYITAKAAAEKWGMSVRQVQNLCKTGGVKGASRHGREWMIPYNSQKPIDRRKNIVQTKDTVELYDFDSFLPIFEPGMANEILSSWKENSLNKDVFQMQLHLYRGEFEQGKRIALSCTKSKANTLQSCHIGMCLAMFAVFTGDIGLWQTAKEYTKSIKANNNTEQNMLDFWFAANESIVYNTLHFTSKFRRGNFEELPKEIHSLARYYYVRYLLISFHENNDWNFTQHDVETFMDFIPLLIEPFIVQTRLEEVLITEVYLHLFCAFVYHFGNREILAQIHVDKAIELCLPDKFYLPLAEHRRQIGVLIDERLLLRDKNAYNEVRKLSKTVQENWAKIHNSVMNKSISSDLTARERQIGRFAVYGFSNKEIATRLNITENAVKQSLRSAMNKTGVSTRKELQRFV